MISLKERRGERLGESIPSGFPHRLGLIIKKFQEIASEVWK